MISTKQSLLAGVDQLLDGFDRIVDRFGPKRSCRSSDLLLMAIIYIAAMSYTQVGYAIGFARASALSAALGIGALASKRISVPVLAERGASAHQPPFSGCGKDITQPKRVRVPTILINGEPWMEQKLTAPDSGISVVERGRSTSRLHDQLHTPSAGMIGNGSRLAVRPSLEQEYRARLK